jgi:hypothetical protein
MEYLHEQLKPISLNASVTKAQEVVFRIQTKLRPELTFYLKTNSRYPQTAPEMIVEKKGKQVEAKSATLENWSTIHGLYEVCLDAMIVSPLYNPRFTRWLLMALGVLGVSVLVLTSLLIGALAKPKAVETLPVAEVPVIATATIPQEAGIVQSLPYEIKVKTLSSVTAYQTVLEANKVDKSLVKNKMLVWYGQPLGKKTELRSISQTTGRVRSVSLDEKGQAQTFNLNDSACQSGEVCQFVLLDTAQKTELSEPLIISRFSLDKFYTIVINVSST